jgi:hypothetical protein
MKGWRKLLSLRFGTKSLFMATTIVAILLFLDNRRLTHQRQLADAIIALGGSYQRVPRDLPDWLRTVLGEERALRVDHIFLPTALYPEVGDDINYRFPHYIFPLGASPPSEFRAPFKFSLPAELVTIFEMPAMDQVTNLHLYGSSVTDDVIPALSALPALRSLTLTGTLLSDHGFDELNRDLTSRGAGLTFPIPRTRSTLWTTLTADLTVFARAERGEVKAVEQLVSLVAGRPVLDANSRPYDAIVDLLSAIPNQQAIELLRQKVLDEDRSVRLLAVTCLGVRRETRHIETAVRDSDSGVRCEAMKQALGLLDDDTLFPLLVRAIDSPHSDVRYTAVSAFDRFQGDQLEAPLLRALDDDNSMVRSAAARKLGDFGTPEVVKALQAAARDGDSTVRRNAVVSLRRADATEGSSTKP